MAEVIRTERLDLIPLEPQTLPWIESGEVAAVERALASQVPVGWTETIPARLRLEQLAADPSVQPWLVRAWCCGSFATWWEASDFMVLPTSTDAWNSATTSSSPTAEGAMPARRSSA